MEEIFSSINVDQGRLCVLSYVTVPVMHTSWSPTVLGKNGADMTAMVRYAAGITGFTIVACSRFLTDETGAYSKNRDLNEPGLQFGVLAQVTFPGDLSPCFKDEFIRSYPTKDVSFTYVFVQLERSQRITQPTSDIEKGCTLSLSPIQITIMNVMLTTLGTYAYIAPHLKPSSR